MAAGLCSLAAAQEAEFRSVSNPYQEGFPFELGEDLSPGVDIEGLRWTLVRITAKSNREIESGQEVPINVDVEFENRRDSAVKVLVVLLFEDERGSSLERLQIEPFRAGGDRFKAVKAKYRVRSDVLIAAEGLYLFCEIQD
jgi:hypothetical protein